MRLAPKRHTDNPMMAPLWVSTCFSLQNVVDFRWFCCCPRIDAFTAQNVKASSLTFCFHQVQRRFHFLERTSCKASRRELLVNFWTSGYNLQSLQGLLNLITMVTTQRFISLLTEATVSVLLSRSCSLSRTSFTCVLSCAAYFWANCSTFSVHSSVLACKTVKVNWNVRFKRLLFLGKF